MKEGLFVFVFVLSVSVGLLCSLCYVYALKLGDV